MQIRWLVMSWHGRKIMQNNEIWNICADTKSIGLNFCRVQVLQELDIVIVVMMSPQKHTCWHTSTFPKWKMPYLLLQSLMDFLVLVICDVHISSHPPKEQHEQITLLKEGKLWFYFWMERAWSPLCCHGNVTVDISWNHVMSVTTTQSFSSMQKKSSKIFHFLWV